FKKKLFGFLALGRKSTLKDYTNEEIQMFDNLVKNIGLALFNAENHELFLQNKLLERDLSIAEDIQRSLLPTDEYTVEGLDIKAFTKSLAKVSGDYFDIKEISDNRVLVLILDVSGKGISAALVMVMIQTVFMNHILFYEDLGTLAKSINKVLISQIRGEKFATAIFLEINKKTGVTKVLNCGHNPMLIIDSKDKVYKVESTSVPLGLMEDLKETITKVKLPKDSLMLMYTDGFTEVQNEKEEQFGEERLIKVSQMNRKKKPQDIVQEVYKAAWSFKKDEKQVDDMTVIAIKKT
ncbi:MAG: PP2C family protein-serine/threonine phosphatase, partial [Spirochaetes bacterium]|nr:PP2C family protein-serine/threonine phosphatase [Spirochaetota bacterium]